MSEDDYTFENLKNLKYIDLVQKETTRFYGPTYGLFVREVAKDHFLKDIPLQKGTLLNAPISSHYNDKYFKDPYVFRPERWEK